MPKKQRHGRPRKVHRKHKVVAKAAGLFSPPPANEVNAMTERLLNSPQVNQARLAIQASKVSGPGKMILQKALEGAVTSAVASGVYTAVADLVKQGHGFMETSGRGYHLNP